MSVSYLTENAVSIKKTIWLMLYMEIIYVYCVNHVTHINILRGKKCRIFLMLNLVDRRVTTER